MKTHPVTVVRLYLSEGEGRLRPLLKQLHEVEKVRGVTVYRGIVGFGPSGHIHDTTLVDLSMDLPLVVEFFDEPGKIAAVLDDLVGQFPSAHILSWSAEVND
jgi:PII-like signaling protein